MLLTVYHRKNEQKWSESLRTYLPKSAKLNHLELFLTVAQNKWSLPIFIMIVIPFNWNSYSSKFVPGIKKITFVSCCGCTHWNISQCTSATENIVRPQRCSWINFSKEENVLSFSLLVFFSLIPLTNRTVSVSTNGPYTSERLPLNDKYRKKYTFCEYVRNGGVFVAYLANQEQYWNKVFKIYTSIGDSSN